MSLSTLLAHHRTLSAATHMYLVHAPIGVYRVRKTDVMDRFSRSGIFINRAPALGQY